MQDWFGKFWSSNQWQICFWIITFFALLLRLMLLPFESGDMKVFLIPWLENLRQNGGFPALGQSFSNYNPPYLYLLALLSYLPEWVPAATCVKLAGIPFDFLAAFFVAKIVQRGGYDIRIQILSYFVALFLPTPVLNSAVWGQCDGIYAAFLVICLYYLLSGLPLRAMVFFGIAVSFKLQAVFMAPALLAFWIAGRISLRHFLVIPAVFVLALLPAFAFGRSIGSLFSIYAEQASYYKNLSLNAPNFYLWFSDGDVNKQIPDTYYSLIAPVGYLITSIFAFFLGVAVFNRRRGINSNIMVALCFVSVLVSPFLLPKMHDRYFYAADIFSLIFAFYQPQLFFVPILMQTASLSVYLNVLFGSKLLTPYWAALLVATLICIVMRHFLKTIWTVEGQEGASSIDPERSKDTVRLPAHSEGIFTLTERKTLLFFVILATLLLFRLPILDVIFRPQGLYIAVESSAKAEIEKLPAVTVIQDWGKARSGSDLNGAPLLVGGVTYDESICIHASSLVTFDLSSSLKDFSGAAVLPDYLISQQASTSVEFKIVADGRILWRSGAVTAKGSEPKILPFQLDVSGVNTLALIVESVDAEITADHACWALLKLSR